MDILVTGASGFLGTALLPRLLGAKHRVTALARTPIAASSLPDASASVEVMSVDLRDHDATVKALSPWRWQAILHLAGPVPKGEETWADAAQTITAHVRFVVHLAAAIPKEWKGRFIHVSSNVVYGNPVRERVAEDHPRNALHPYALAKCLAEDVLLGSSTLGDRWLLRVGGLFSEQRKSGALFHFLRAAHAGEPLRVTTSTPPVPWQILHVDDAVEALMRCLNAPSTTRDPGPINVGYGEPIQIVDIAERIAKRGTRGSTVTLTGPPAPVFDLDIAKARKLIAWPPVTLDERLDRLWTATQ